MSAPGRRHGCGEILQGCERETTVIALQPMLFLAALVAPCCLCNHVAVGREFKLRDVIALFFYKLFSLPLLPVAVASPYGMVGEGALGMDARYNRAPGHPRRRGRGGVQ